MTEGDPIDPRPTTLGRILKQGDGYRAECGVCPFAVNDDEGRFALEKLDTHVWEEHGL